MLRPPTPVIIVLACGDERCCDQCLRFRLDFRRANAWVWGCGSKTPASRLKVAPDPCWGRLYCYLGPGLAFDRRYRTHWRRSATIGLAQRSPPARGGLPWVSPPVLCSLRLSSSSDLHRSSIASHSASVRSGKRSSSNISFASTQYGALSVTVPSSWNSRGMAKISRLSMVSGISATQRPFFFRSKYGQRGVCSYNTLALRVMRRPSISTVRSNSYPTFRRSRVEFPRNFFCHCLQSLKAHSEVSTSIRRSVSLSQARMSFLACR
jgi:hypothetical protein